MKNQRVKGTLNEKPAGEGHPSMKNQRVKGIPKNTKAPHRAGLLGASEKSLIFLT